MWNRKCLPRYTYCAFCAFASSTVAVIHSFEETVISFFEVCQIGSELSVLARRPKNLDGETRIVLEITENYHYPLRASSFKRMPKFL